VQLGTGQAGDGLIFGFWNIRIIVQFVLDIESSGRAPENGMSHREKMTDL
jgi:hypothetical protein